MFSPISFGCKLGFDHDPQFRQKLMRGAPYKAMRHVLVVVPVDIAGARHLAPRDAWMARLDFVRQAADASETISRQRVMA
jgi:hypothetical protein